MLENIKVLYHSSIKICKNKIIYIDPFKIEEDYNDADIVLITHSHYDHYSPEDINKVIKKDTIIVVSNDLIEELKKNNVNENKIIGVEPNKTYIVSGVKIETTLAYNINKKFHSKENNWVGYILEINNVRYYIAGDTDEIEEVKQIKCDVAFVPVGGIYTMNAKEAADLVNIIKPKIAIPIHYGSIVGEEKDAVEFINLLNKNINGMILLNKEEKNV